MARFVPENTIAEFLQAAPALSKQADVVIVGSSGHGGELDAVAARLSEENNNIHWLGHVNDDRRLFALWQQCGAYFHGHSVGGTNPALVQAMALGATVVARDTVYNREVLGDSGFFCEPQSLSIEAAVTTALAGGQELGKKAQARAQSNYSWELVNSRYEESLRSMVEHR